MDLRLPAQLTAEDYADAQFLHGRRVAFILYLGIAVLVFAGVLLVAGGIANPGVRIVAMLGALACVIGGFRARTKGIAIRARKQFAQQTSLHAPYEIWITDASLHLSSARGQGSTPWGDFKKWRANEKIILLYQTDLLFHLIPRRFFAAEKDFQDFKHLLMKAIGPAGRLRKSG